MEKRKQSAIESGFLIVIIAGILVAINALSAFGLYARKDTTKNERYTLSKGSGNLLRGMKQHLIIDAYVTKGLPKLDAFVRDLRDMLQEYKVAGGEKFDFSIIEAKDAETREKAKKAGLEELSFGEASDTEEKAAVTKGYMGLVFRYGEQEEKIPVLDPGHVDGLEFWITNRIREVRDKGDDIHHKIGVLTGHDELKLTDGNLVPGRKEISFQAIITNNFPFYSIEEVDLKGGDSAVPETLDGLIITQPSKDLTEKELRRIDQFVMKGKSLAVLASAVNLKASDATMNATLSTHGLEKLLEGYGVTMNKDVVLDFGRPMRVTLMTQGGIAMPLFPDVAQIQDDPRFTGDETLLDTAFAPFFRIENLAVPFASSLAIDKKKQPDAKLAIHARTTPYSTHETGETVDLSPFQKWATRAKGEKHQFAVAADVEGTLATAFPEGDKQGVDAPAKSVKPSRVFVFSSSQFLTNPFARSGAAPEMPPQMQQMMGNRGGGGDRELQTVAGPYAQAELTNSLLIFKNTLDWLSGDTDLLAVSAKITADPALVYGALPKPVFGDESEDQLRRHEEELRHSKVHKQHQVEWTLILGIPLLFVVVGVARRGMREASRAKVSLA